MITVKWNSKDGWYEVALKMGNNNTPMTIEDWDWENTDMERCYEEIFGRSKSAWGGSTATPRKYALDYVSDRGYSALNPSNGSPTLL